VTAFLYNYLEADRTRLTLLSPKLSFGDLLCTGATTFAGLGLAANRINYLEADQTGLTLLAPKLSFGDLLCTGATTFAGLALATDKIIEMASVIVAKASREDALNKIDNFAHASDWVGPRTVLPNDSTQLIARTFVEGLPPSIATPHVSLGADGTIGFEWETRQDYIAVEIQADARVVWMHRRQGIVVGGEEVVWHGRIPGPLAERLNQTFA
jgi:hypothetical protein